MKLHDEIKKYAELTLTVGLNLKEGQTLVINSTLEAAPFTRCVAQMAYEMGAKEVHVQWSDDELNLIRYKYATDEALSSYPQWKADSFLALAKEKPCYLAIASSDPSLLKDIPAYKVAASNKASAMALEEYQTYRAQNELKWCVIGYPGAAWASKVFPDLPVSEAQDMLWEKILMTVRADKADPAAEWNKHIVNLNEKIEYLNSKKYKALHYTAPGTDLMVELPEKSLWEGGAGAGINGEIFVANMPTEEVFTVPERNGVNGTLRSTMPLNYSGSLIKNFSLVFKDGEVVDFDAEEGKDVLEGLFSIDNGAKHLGEVALIPVTSPIAKTGVIFLNTLYDENASCHFAFGKGYPTCIENGVSMSKEELEKNGVNSSLTHVDFMVGSPELDIDGIKEDGTREAIFRNGQWAF